MISFTTDPEKDKSPRKKSLEKTVGWISILPRFYREKNCIYK